ncbi:MAG: hypothetical protein Ta2A_02790 [Treponemataceae bacterium]|nr:MAG: hypothetical protein Ta2A_02790 [Treponemataceae bacterium]
MQEAITAKQIDIIDTTDILDILDIVYQDDEKLIVNKPAGLSVQGGSGVKNSLDVLLRTTLHCEIFPVHRLDKETAGLIVFAKTGAAAAALSRDFSCGKIKKEYAAISARPCDSAPVGNNRSENTSVEENEEKIPKKGIFSNAITIDGKTKSALTHYTLLRHTRRKIEQLGVVAFAYFSLVLDTGRKHQIRIHLAKNGFPIAADDKYGDFALNKILKKTLGIKKLCLAAVSLEIPGAGRFSAPLPPHMQQVCEIVPEICANQ